MPRVITLVGLAAALLWAACEQQPATEQAETTEPAVDIAAEEAAIRQVTDAYAQGIAAEDIEALVGFWTDDARWTMHDGTTITGPTEFREFYGAMLESPNPASMEISPEATTVAASGDVAHEVGTYTVTTTTPEGQSATQTFRYVVLFRKVDGAWKVTGGMDTAPVMPAAAEAETSTP